MTRALLAAALVLAGCAPHKPTLVDDRTAGVGGRGGDALELTLPRYPDGTPWRLADSRGKVVLLDVWATWCEPCRDALPLYQDFASEFRARGLEVYAISVDADARAIAGFLEETKLSLPVLHDPEAAVATSALRVKLMPTAYLVDRRGRLRFVHEGFDEGQLSTWLSELELLLAEPAP